MQNLFSSWLFILEKTGSVNLSPNGGCVLLSLHSLLRLYCPSHPFQRLLNSPKHSLWAEGMARGRVHFPQACRPHLPVAITKAKTSGILGSAFSWVVPEASGLAAALL